MNPVSRRAGFTARRMTLVFILTVVLAIFFSPVLFSPDATATEGGGGAYPNGAEDFMSGAVPPPGFYFINYFTYYSADKFKIKDDGEIPDFKLRVTADTLRFIYVTKQQIFGGFWGMHIFLPFLNVDVTLPTGSQSRFSIGDIIVDPIIISWHSKNWHFTTGVDIYMPTGPFDKDRIANVGRNYWTFEPIAAFTFLSDGGFEQIEEEPRAFAAPQRQRQQQPDERRDAGERHDEAGQVQQRAPDEHKQLGNGTDRGQVGVIIRPDC